MTEKLSAFPPAVPTLAKFVAGANATGNEKYSIQSLLNVGLFENTAVNILAATPVDGTNAFATDIGVEFHGSATTWLIDSSYYVPISQNNDLGANEFSNRIGYGQNYVTDKALVNCTIGFGSAPGSEGGLRFNPATGILQIFHNGTWINITLVSPGTLRDNQAAFNFALEDKPIGQWIQVFSGDSETTGLNGLPLVQGYRTDMGSNPAPQQVNGGTF